MLHEQALETKAGMAALVDFMKDSSAENGERVDKAEERADELRRILIDELNRTFITPFDREDIFALSRVMDDVIDYGKSTVEEMILLNIAPNPQIQEIVDILYEGTAHLASAMEHMEKHPGVCPEHIIMAKKAENKIERRYRQALAALFQTNDVILILKTREVYRHLSNAADRIAEAADRISDVLVKHA